MSSQIFTTAGTYSWTAPDGVTSVTVQCWGGGAAGGDSAPAGPQSGGSGGAGGDYADATLTVIPGTSYAVVVGAAGVGDHSPGGDTYFDDGSQVYAIGGDSVNADVGTNIFVGGLGGLGHAGVGGIGGGGAGSQGDGQGGGGIGAGAGGVPDGGSGGTVPGAAGSQPGGGGAGASGHSQPGGSGGDGQVGLAWTPAPPPPPPPPPPPSPSGGGATLAEMLHVDPMRRVPWGAGRMFEETRAERERRLLILAQRIDEDDLLTGVL